MKKHFIFFSLIYIFGFVSASFAGTQSGFPERQSYVNDFAKILSKTTKTNLDIYLQNFEDKTTNQILIATFPTYGDSSMESFGNQLAREWKIGYKDQNNGIILILFQKEHRAWIEIGVGLENELPYTFSRQLIRDVLAPRFRNAEYDKGISEGVLAIIHEIDPDYSQALSEKPPAFSIPFLYLLSIAFTITLILDLISYSSYRYNAKHALLSYQKQIGTYSFLEWWLLYGTITSMFEFIYFNLIVRWINPSFVITGSGYRKGSLRPGSGRGRFFGNGISGNW